MGNAAGHMGHMLISDVELDSVWYSGLAVLPSGRVMVADYGAHAIYMLENQDDGAWVRRTIAGNNGAGHENGDAMQAKFNHPVSLAVLPTRPGAEHDRVLVVDQRNNCIRMLTQREDESWRVATVAGAALDPEQQFNNPSSVAVLSDGRVLVADTGHHRIALISDDLTTVSTIAGSPRGFPGYKVHFSAQFNFPHGIAVLSDDRVLVADFGNESIRMLKSIAGEGWIVSTIAGDSSTGVDTAAKDNDDALKAQFQRPRDIFKLRDGRVLVSDFTGIRVLTKGDEDSWSVSTLFDPDRFLVYSDKCVAFAQLQNGRVLVGINTKLYELNPRPSPEDDGERVSVHTLSSLTATSGPLKW